MKLTSKKRLTEHDAPYRMEFTAWQKRQALKRARGICQCGCGQPFGEHPKERPVYDHIQAAELGGRSTDENCRAIRLDCHEAKTREDMTIIRKGNRWHAKENRLTGRVKRHIPGSKASGFKIGIDGTVSRRRRVRVDGDDDADLE